MAASLFAALALALVQAGLLVSIARDKSDTADETRYVASAATIWATHAYRDLCEAPILPKWGFALALRAANPTIAATPLSWQAAHEQLIAHASPDALRATFFAARRATVFVVVVAGLLLWSAGSRWGPGAGLVAQALWCFSPTVLANGSLATLDAWSAAAMCAFLWTGLRLYDRPTLARAIALGIAVGVGAATKVTTLLAVPIVAAYAWWLSARGDATRWPRRRLAQLLLPTAAAAAVTLWALYGFSIGGVDRGDPCPFGVRTALLVSGLVPFPAWIEGLLFQLRHGSEGHANYLFGETRSQGWWWFYLVCLAFKVTLGAQAIPLLRVAASAVTVKRGTPLDFRLDAALLAFPLALFLAMSVGKHQPNVGFLLPAFPWVMLWAGRSFADVGRAFGTPGRALLVGLVALGAVEALRLHPHHLMFFNLWAGGPENGPRYLVHREDWGQDKLRLAEWQRANGIERLYYAPYGPNAAAWGIVFDPVPCEPRPGVYALHAAEVHRPRFSLRPGCIDWLTIEPPDERIGYSIYVYRVDEARLARLATERREGRTPFWKSGPAKTLTAPGAIRE